MRMFKWYLINGVFACVMYAGFIYKIDGAENVAFFFAWLNILLSIAYLSDSTVKLLREKGRPVPSWVNFIYDIVIAAVFVWFGAWVTGLFWVFHLLLQEAAWIKAEEKEL